MNHKVRGALFFCLQTRLIDRISSHLVQEMMKRSIRNFSVLVWLVFFAAGCSSFHEVSVVSHGDEVAIKQAELEEVVVHEPPPPVVELEAVQSQEVQSIVIPPIHATHPVAPPLASASAKTSMSPDIFAQSADDSTLPWTLADVFFDFDQIVIRADAIPLLEENARVLLKRYANRDVLIQGHCDERGTDAYNFILGKRRAKAVKDYLVDLGVPSLQLHVLSLGKSQPFCLQRTIPCLRQNRRAHFVLK